MNLLTTSMQCIRARPVGQRLAACTTDAWITGWHVGVSDGPCAVSAEMGLDVDEPGYAHVGPHSEPASARAGFHALLRTGSMHAAASQAMSAEEFYDHLADTGWLTFLNAPHVFEAGDDMPADILMGTEIEAARL